MAKCNIEGKTQSLVNTRQKSRGKVKKIHIKNNNIKEKPGIWKPPELVSFETLVRMFTKCFSGNILDECTFSISHLYLFVEIRCNDKII